ncbi:MAG: chromosome segregation protein SMC [Parvularcula sp.]
MEFEKLRLTGFKSFVEPTDFEIRPGLTGVVGPNGCGKSNLLEALRWVMGATSAKALRAGGMEDVIFAGTSMGDRPGRPGRSWAEVSLHINNEERTAPAEYNEHPALEISRRITKKAEGTSSTYRINGKEVRAKDVQLLFADAATGANSPALVRQGQVSDLINAKPENRRKFLEEAAGVTGLHVRRHEAELRLKAASTNLERLEDVTGELETQRGVLARQARQATRYRNIAGHLKRAEALLAFARWQEAEAALAAAETSLAEANQDYETALRANVSANAEREKQHDLVEPIRQKEAEAAAALHRLEVERDNADREMERARSDIERLTEQQERLERDLAREKDLGSDADEALETLAQEETALRERAENETAALNEAHEEVRRAAAALTEAETAAETAQRQVAEAEAEKRAITSALEKVQRTVHSLEQEVARARQEKATFDASPSHEGKIAALRGSLGNLSTLAETAARDLDAATTARREAAEAAEQCQSPRDESAAAVNKLQAEVDTLRQILAEADADGPAILDRIDVDPGYEAALAAAFEDGLSAPDDPEADRHWSPLGRTPLDGPALPSGAHPLADHVRAPDLLSRRLGQIGIIDPDQLEAVLPHLKPGQRLVSKAGDLWRWDGLVVKAGAKTPAAQRLEQKRQLAERENGLETAFSARDAAERALGEAKVALNTAARDEDEKRGELQRAREAILTTERQLASLEAEEARRASRAEALAAKLQDTEHRLEKAQGDAAEAAGKAQALADLSALHTELTRLTGIRNDARAANGRARGRRADMQRDADARTARLAQIAEQQKSWARRKETALERIASVIRSHEETVAEHARAARLPEQLTERCDQIAELLAAAESRRRVAADELATVQTALTEAERTVRKTTEAEALAREVRARAEGQVDACRERLAGVLERASEVHDGEPAELLTIAEHKPDAAMPSHDDLERKIDRLKRERESLGGVNLCADQEMEEIDARLTEITTEREDCEAAIAKLRAAIGNLNRDGRQRLLDAFDRVNANFKSLFTKLFGGGSAELRLVDSDDPLEAGLEIFASPPGKKLASMSLMSGGEQALTATALIFAVFKSNPAPVCVLDEVDAPLDDANTDRFCSMLHEMAAETKTRFIAITHHPLTMSRMDRLYGVTMVERGVSQLVSVDLAEAEKMAA